MVCGSEIWMLALETNGRENFRVVVRKISRITDICMQMMQCVCVCASMSIYNTVAC